jgi:hypothetical protein
MTVDSRRRKAMTRGVGGQSPANVQTYLKGVAYPAKKDDLIQKAQDNDAPDEVLDILQQLPDGEYGGPQDVMKAYGQVKSGAG